MSNQSHQKSARYNKVFDQRKRRVRGLWERNGTYYAQMTVEDENTGKKIVRRVRMEDAEGKPVTTVPEAVKVMQKMRVKRDESELKLFPKRTPILAEYGVQYLDFIEALKNKKPNTINRERTAINALGGLIGELRLRQINNAVVMRYMAARKKAGKSARSINLEVITLRNVLRHAKAEGHLNSIAINDVEWLHQEPKKKRLVSLEEIEHVCQAALKHLPDAGPMLADFLRLMAFSGGRWAETLRLKWADVDWEREQLTIGSDGLTKNREARVVDFNGQLKRHLRDMAKRKQPDSVYLFPSPRREGRDVPTVTLNMALRKAREKSKVTDFTCHLCRHFFISYCVMSGIDYMTIARWVGHKDGGILIGKVYGHLSNEHTQRQAQRVNFDLSGGNASLKSQ
jgi:integrase